jgi:hypothetical protein
VNTKDQAAAQRSLFLANVAKRELKHLQATDRRLFVRLESSTSTPQIIGYDFEL